MKMNQPELNFFMFPPIGEEDWRYGFATAKVRAMETEMLPKSTLLDMINAPGFNEAVDMLSSSEYATSASDRSLASIENMLLEKRRDVRKLFADLMIDEGIVEIFKARQDFLNLRLALRRRLLDKPIGNDYTDQGNVAVSDLIEIIEQEEYYLAPYFLQEAIEEAVLAYYESKEIPAIDYAIDKYEARYKIEKARELDNIFLEGLFRIQVDMTNLGILLRLKFRQSEQRGLFIDGGFIPTDQFESGLELGFDSMSQLFTSQPYNRIVEEGASYISTKGSFLRFEHLIDAYMDEFLGLTMQIAAGPQPVIAFLLLKEEEIRNVRLILTAKKNQLDNQLLIDRIGK